MNLETHLYLHPFTN